MTGDIAFGVKMRSQSKELVERLGPISHRLISAGAARRLFLRHAIDRIACWWLRSTAPGRRCPLEIVVADRDDRINPRGLPRRD